METITIKRDVECEIFTFPTEEDRQDFIGALRQLKSDVPYATNMDPEESEPERYLVAIPISLYNFVQEGE